MQTPPLVSVIIPVYNREDYLKSCLEDITRQSYKKLEVIVVDDASTDNSLAVARSFETVKVIALSQNGGPSVARNTGINAATGDFIHFMDSDDRINSDFYTEMVRAIIETGADIACCGMIHQRAKHKTQLFRKRKVFTKLNDKLSVTFVGRWGYSVRYLFRSTFLAKHNLRFAEGRIIEDLPFSFSAIFFAEKLVTVPHAEYLYVFNPSSLLTDKKFESRAKRHVDKRFAREQILDFARSHGDFSIPYVTTGQLRYILYKLYVILFGTKQIVLTEDL